MENDLVKQQHEEAKIEKFKIFAERNAQSTKDYAQIFSQLVTRYDSINNQDFSGQKAVRKFFETRKISNETALDAPYIHFGICTEVIKNEGGRWMAFPKIQKGKVVAIMIAYADKEDIRVGYREMAHTTDFYRDFVGLFQKAFDEEVSKNKGKNKANRGETLIDEVVITYFNSNRYDWNYLRSLIFDLERFQYYRDYSFWDTCNYSAGLEARCAMFGICQEDYTGGGYTEPPNPPKKTKEEKCREAKGGVAKANIFLSDPRMKNVFTDKMRHIAQNTTNAETSITIGKNANGELHIGGEYTKEGRTGYVVDPPQGYEAYVDGHNHELGSPPSYGDIWGMLERVKKYPIFETRFIFSKNDAETIYALTVTDREKVLAFLQKYPKEMYINEKGGLIEGTKIYDEVRKIRSKYSYDMDDSMLIEEIARAFLLSEFNMGIALSKTSKENRNTLRTMMPNVTKQNDGKEKYTYEQCY